MSGGFWNPITWLISVTADYNIYTINLEALFYVLIGGLGMNKVGKLFDWPLQIRLIAATCYMCCGYFVGNLQHLNWISGAGYLPLCYYFYMQLLKKPSLQNLILNALVFSLLITSSHPGILIGSIYLFSFVTGNYLLKDFQSKKSLKEIFYRQKAILFLLLLLTISNAALIASYLELLPYTTRDSKPVVESITSNAVNARSLISFIMPFATVKGESFYLTDIAFRNLYIGLIIIVFVIFGIACDIKKRKLDFFFLWASFFLFLSIGSALQSKIYSTLPLINYVRLPAEFRIFALFGFILYGCSALNKYILNGEGKNSIRKIIISLFFLVLAAFIFSLVRILQNSDSFLNHTSLIVNQNNFLLKAKTFIDYLSVYDTVIIQGVVVLTLLLVLLNAIRSINIGSLLLIALVDVFFATIIQLPFTGYGKLSQSKIQEIVAKSPSGIPIPDMHAIMENDQGSKNIDSIVGNWSFYNKQPGTTQQALYPIVFKNEEYIFHKDSMQNIKHKPFLYFLENSKEKQPGNLKNTLEISYYSPNLIKFKLQTNTPGKVIIQYKYFPYWIASINNQQAAVTQYNNAFIALPIDAAGTFIIELKYSPSPIINLFMMQTLLLLLELGLLIYLVIKNR